MPNATNASLPRREERKFEGIRVTRRLSANIDDVVAGFRARMGRLPISAVTDLAKQAGSVDAFEAALKKLIPESGFAIFHEIDHGAWLQKYGLGLKNLRWIFGNPLIAVTMLRHDATAGLFVPIEMLFTENPDGGCTITYVVPSSLIAIGDNPSLLAAATRLDHKLEALISSVAG